MTRQQEENIMGWWLIALGILTIVAIINATPTPPSHSQDAPCKHSH